MRILLWATPIVMGIMLLNVVILIVDGDVLSGLARLGLVVFLGFAWENNRRRLRTDDATSAPLRSPAE